MFCQHLFIYQAFIELTLWARQGAKHRMNRGEQDVVLACHQAGILQEGVPDWVFGKGGVLDKRHGGKKGRPVGESQTRLFPDPPGIPLT